MDKFDNFVCEYYNINWEQATSDHTESFVTYLHKEKGLASSSIRSIPSGIAYIAQGKLKKDITKSFMIDKLLKKYQKEAPPPSLKRLPIQRALLKKLPLM